MGSRRTTKILAVTTGGAFLLFANLYAQAAVAKPIGEALTVMLDSQATDPAGFTLMIISIGLLVIMAGTLIGVTSYMALKKKPKRTEASIATKEASDSHDTSGQGPSNDTVESQSGEDSAGDSEEHY